MVESFAAQCRAADYKLTLTGSWVKDQEEYPGFWNDVYLCWQIDQSQEQVVENTMETVKALQSARSG